MHDCVGVVGANGMSSGIAQLLAEAGHDVLLLGDAATRDAACRMIERKAAKGQLDRAAADSAAARIEVVPAMASLARCGVVIESALGDRPSTQACVKALEGVLADDAVIALNTSAQPVSVLASGAAHPRRIAGLHFFEPAPLMRAVEVIAGLRTAPEVLARMVAFVRGLGHTPLEVRDAPGFVVNHIGRALFIEGSRIVDEGVAQPAVVDRIARATLGLRMGPFELLDLIGLDISLPVMEQLYREFREEPRLRPPAFLSSRVAAGLLGRKTGEGFYRHPQEGAQPRVEHAAFEPASAPAFWLDPADAEFHAPVRQHLAGVDIRWDDAKTPGRDSLCLVMPLGVDASRTVAARGLDPARTVAVDAASGLTPCATLMAAPGVDERFRGAACAAFAAAGAAEWIKDSPGFVAQRLLAAIVNLACEVAQRGTATPEEIDTAVRISLGYPRGPLAWGDAFGAHRILRILRAAQADGDPRDRPSRWLARRAELGIPLTMQD